MMPSLLPDHAHSSQCIQVTGGVIAVTSARTAEVWLGEAGEPSYAATLKGHPSPDTAGAFTLTYAPQVAMGGGWNCAMYQFSVALSLF